MFHNHPQSQMMGERPSTPSLRNILTRIYESLNAFERVCSGLDPLNCCKMPTMPPNMASPKQKQKGLFQFSCLLGELTQINQIATSVGHQTNLSNCNKRSLWGITEQLPTIFIRLSSPRKKLTTQPPPSYTAKMTHLSQPKF